MDFKLLLNYKNNNKIIKEYNIRKHKKEMRLNIISKNLIPLEMFKFIYVFIF